MRYDPSLNYKRYHGPEDIPSDPTGRQAFVRFVVRRIGYDPQKAVPILRHIPLSNIERCLFQALKDPSSRAVVIQLLTERSLSNRAIDNLVFVGLRDPALREGSTEVLQKIVPHPRVQRDLVRALEEPDKRAYAEVLLQSYPR